jgi:hypothetical protein
MEQNKKVRLGSGKKRKDSWLTASICITDALNNAYEYNGKKYVNVNINIAEQPNQYGKDVEITLNTYSPDKKTNVPTQQSAKVKVDDDFMF